MSEVTKHTPGMLCWTDLATSDLAGARQFYSELFGWKVEDSPMPGGGGVYGMALLGGKSVGGLAEMAKQEQSRGMPPHWNTYFSVDNVDAAAKKVEPSGGKLLQAPFDIPEVGRMCVVADPSGAIFCLYQATRHIGAERVNEPGALCWTELETHNVEACRAFYTRLFGWKAEDMSMGPGMKYTVFKVGDTRSCGMMPMGPQTPKGTAPHWMVYFAVVDCDAIAKRARSLTGNVMVPPTDIPNVGRFSVISDPQKAVFGVLQPKLS